MSLEYDIPGEIVGLLAPEEIYYRDMYQYTRNIRLRQQVSLESVCCLLESVVKKYNWS